MKKYFVFLSIFISSMTIVAQKRFNINLSADMGPLSGYTKYHISFIEYIPEVDTNIMGESELEFPMDVFGGGIKAGVNVKLNRKASLSFNANIHKSITDPNNTMKDSDWFTYPYPGGKRWKWSYTESDAKLNAFIIDVKQKFGISIFKKIQLSEIFVYRYENFSYDIFGVSGWQWVYYDSTWYRVYFDEYQGRKVMDYMVSYYIPSIGIGAEMEVSPDININGEYAFSPNALAKDFDDHILRKKTSEGNGKGNAFIADLSALLKIPYPSIKEKNWYVKLHFNLIKITTSGYQTQRWYGDDPISEEDDTGDVITGINTDITSTVQKVILLIGCKF